MTMTMTHTEKQFLFNCGEHNWTDTWFDIFPQEIINLIYKFVNKNVINELDKRFNYEIENHGEWQKYTFDIMMPHDVEKIYKFCNMKKTELKMYCRQNKIKQGVGNKWSMVGNICERYKGRKLTDDEESLIW